METLDLQRLSTGLGCITPQFGSALAQAGGVSLEKQGHRQGKQLDVEGDFARSFTCTWLACDDQAFRCWNDQDLATEFGAEGIAILLVYRFLDVGVIERSCKGTGFDYWLGDDASTYPFQGKARLEVSGIAEGTASSIKRRVRKKLAQTTPSDPTGLTAYVVVVEFSFPGCTFIKK